MTKTKENKQRKRYASWSNYRLVNRVIELEGQVKDLTDDLTKVNSRLMKM